MRRDVHSRCHFFAISIRNPSRSSRSHSSRSDHERASVSSVTIAVNALVRITILILSPRARPIVPSAPVLLTFTQQVPVGLSRVNRLLQTYKCSCHLEIYFLFTKCPNRFLFISLESEEVFIQILCHLKNRRTVYFFTDSPKQILKAEQFS